MKLATEKCRIYPETIPNDWRKEPRRRAELLLYERLRENLSKDWRVFYDVAWLAKVRGAVPEDGQTDFVLLHPDYGILLLEVKGGIISFSAQTGEWTSVDSSGRPWKIKDAFHQVERSKYALKNKMLSIPGLANKQISLYDCVAFPDVKVGEASLRLDAPSEVIIDFEDLGNLEKKLFSIFSYLSAGRKTPLASAEMELFTRLFAPTIELRNPLSAQFALEEQDMIKLTSQQFKTLEGLRRVPRLAVAGCAGSGKTIIAVEKVRQLAQEGFKTLLCCYNTQLAEYLAEQTSQIVGVDVKTFGNLVEDFAKTAGLNLSSVNGGTFDDVHAALLLSEASGSEKNEKYDAIVVDEAQDFHRDWWDALDCCLTSGKQSVLYAFYDDNQNLYRREFEIPDNFVPWDLHDNVRNTQPIFRHAEHFYLRRSERRIEPRGPAGRPVQWLKFSNPRDLEKSLDNLLKQLVRTEQINPRDIVVLTPRELEQSELLTLQLADPFKLIPLGNKRKGDEINCASIHAFKGLERDIVILTELDDRFSARPKEDIDNLLYVGVSRAKNHLVVLSHKSFDEKLLPRR